MSGASVIQYRLNRLKRKQREPADPMDRNITDTKRSKLIAAAVYHYGHLKPQLGFSIGDVIQISSSIYLLVSSIEDDCIRGHHVYHYSSQACDNVRSMLKDQNIMVREKRSTTYELPLKCGKRISIAGQFKLSSIEIDGTKFTCSIVTDTKKSFVVSLVLGFITCSSSMLHFSPLFEIFSKIIGEELVLKLYKVFKYSNHGELDSDDFGNGVPSKMQPICLEKTHCSHCGKKKKTFKNISDYSFCSKCFEKVRPVAIVLGAMTAKRNEIRKKMHLEMEERFNDQKYETCYTPNPFEDLDVPELCALLHSFLNKN
jgi:hypothetical protein